MLVSLLDFPDNAYSGCVRSTLLKESANQMAGVAIDRKGIKNNLRIKSRTHEQNQVKITS